MDEKSNNRGQRKAMRKLVIIPVSRRNFGGLTVLLGLILSLVLPCTLVAQDMSALKSKAEQGSAISQFNLGVMYAKGKGVPQDDKEAFKWYHKAAEQGYARAQNNLGVMYAKGKGVPKNREEAFKWYHKAAEQGNARAQNNLGVMYAKGRGVPKNLEEACKWYRMAAKQGNAQGLNNLGVLCQR